MKTALITGANKSIGLETARQLAEKGIYIFIGSRNLENGQQVVEKLKSEGYPHTQAVAIAMSNSKRSAKRPSKKKRRITRRK